MVNPILQSRDVSTVGVMEITPTVEMFLLLGYEFIVCHNTTVVV